MCEAFLERGVVPPGYCFPLSFQTEYDIETFPLIKDEN